MSHNPRVFVLDGKSLVGLINAPELLVAQKKIEVLLASGKLKLAADAAETIALTLELAQQQNELIETQFGPLKALELVQLDPEQASPAAETIEYRVFTAFGVAALLANGGEDVPLVSAGLEKFAVPLYTGAVGYELTWQDLWREDLLQVALNSELPRIAIQALDRKNNEVILIGVAETGTSGLLNNPNVPITSVTNGSWDLLATTGEQVLADLKEIEQIIIETTLENHYPDTLLVPTSLFSALTRPFSTASPGTIWSYFNEQSALRIEKNRTWTLRRLSDLDDLDGVPTVLAYENIPEVVSVHLPIAARELPAFQKSLSTIQPVISRVAGAVWKRPLAGVAIDNAHS